MILTITILLKIKLDRENADRTFKELDVLMRLLLLQIEHRLCMKTG